MPRDVNTGETKRDFLPFRPASPDESPIFKKSLNIMLFTALPVHALLSYALSIMFMQHPEVFTLVWSVLGGSFARKDLLASYDGVSHYSFVSTLAVSVCVGVPIAIAGCYLYWRHVIKTGHVKKLESGAVVATVVNGALICFLTWFTFVYNFEIGGLPGTKSSALFLWPVFPLWGAIATFTTSALCFTLFGGFYKIFSRHRGGDDV